MTRFREMLAGDAVQLVLQPSQHVTLGVTRPVLSYEDGAELAAGGPCWTALEDPGSGSGTGGRILACFGATFLWPPREGFAGHAVLWALLGCGLGAAHVAITRFIAARIAESPIGRLEAIVRAEQAAEAKWPVLIGLSLVCVMHRWGPDADTRLLFERVLPDLACHPADQRDSGSAAAPRPLVEELA